MGEVIVITSGYGTYYSNYQSKRRCRKDDNYREHRGRSFNVGQEGHYH